MLIVLDARFSDSLVFSVCALLSFMTPIAQNVAHSHQYLNSNTCKS